MGGLKPISHKGFNEFIKGKGLKGRNNRNLNELKAKFGLKPMNDRRMLVISSEDMELKTFDSLLRYAKNENGDFIKKDEKIYKIKWC